MTIRSGPAPRSRRPSLLVTTTTWLAIFTLGAAAWLQIRATRQLSVPVAAANLPAYGHDPHLRPHRRHRVVADEYAAVSAQVDALYGQALELPADFETASMAKLRREAHARMLGNGLCTRPVELDCRMESACETCTYFQTSVEFIPTLRRQRDHARDHNQPDRAALFDDLLAKVNHDDP